MFKNTTIGLAIAVLALFTTPSMAGIISSTSLYTADPTGAWSYFESSQFQPPGQSTTYFPTSLAEIASAQYQGFVRPDPVLSAITGGDTWLGNGTASYQVFKTFLRSKISQTITVAVAGDDGHSLFVDQVFRGGTGFGGAASFDVQFQAGQVREILLAGYNGPANWVFAIGSPRSLPLPSINPQFEMSLSQVAGIEMRADGGFATVPEPSTALIFILSVSSLLVARKRKGGRDLCSQLQSDARRRAITCSTDLVR